METIFFQIRCILIDEISNKLDLELNKKFHDEVFSKLYGVFNPPDIRELESKINNNLINKLNKNGKHIY